MKNKANQIYEEYWSYTAAYTDMNGKEFLAVLQTCINFFDEHGIGQYTAVEYENLQRQVHRVTGITTPSVRKAINQLVKLGFLKPYLQGYFQEAKEYVEASTDRKRQSLLSKIVYRHCNFNNSMTKPDVSGYGQIKFFLKTLEEVGAIDDRALVALMAIDIDKYPAGYLSKEELEHVFLEANKIGFIERKYNQISHLKNLLGKLDDLRIHDHVIYFKTDADRLFGENEEARKSVRDPYLQRVYKTELEEESMTRFVCESPKCMLEGLAYPVLIASHIKPYKLSEADEAFDVNNGLLLSKNMDSLFDLGYITFDSEGSIILSDSLDRDMIEYLDKFRLPQDFINPKRMEYMAYHNQYVFEKKFAKGHMRGNALQVDSVGLDSEK